MNVKTKFTVVFAMLLLSGTAVAITPDTNIYLTPHPDHISFYNNSTYITCNFTNQESANVTIKFERYNTTNNSTDVIHDFGEFATNQTSQFNITNSNFSTGGGIGQRCMTPATRSYAATGLR